VESPTSTLSLTQLSPPPPSPIHDAESRRLLEEAASLMEMCTNPDIDQDEHERKQLLAIARETLLRSMRPPEVGDSIQGNTEGQAGGECVVCCDETADTVLLPCGHLALCSVSIYPI
jgi:hypothetical protein